jgi:hypothetical protein
MTNMSAADTNLGSWPLLRLDQIDSVASDVLQQSLSELAALYPEDDDATSPLSSYVQRQRARSLEVLAARDAQARVEALLAGRQLVRSDAQFATAAAADAPAIHSNDSKQPLSCAVRVPLPLRWTGMAHPRCESECAPRIQK